MSSPRSSEPFFVSGSVDFGYCQPALLPGAKCYLEGGNSFTGISNYTCVPSLPHISSLPRPTSICCILEDVCNDKTMELSLVLSWVLLVQQQHACDQPDSSLFIVASACLIFEAFNDHFHGRSSVPFCVFQNASFCCLNARCGNFSHDVNLSRDEKVAAAAAEGQPRPCAGCQCT